MSKGRLLGNGVSVGALGAIEFLPQLVELVPEARTEGFALSPPALERRTRHQAALLRFLPLRLVVRLREQEVKMAQSEAVKGRLCVDDQQLRGPCMAR